MDYAIITSYIYRDSGSKVFARDMSSYNSTVETWTDLVNAVPTVQEFADNEAAAIEWARPAPSLSGQLASQFNALPLDVKAAFAPLRVSVEDAIHRGDLDVAKRIIELTAVPVELEATKSSLAALFN